MKMIPLRFYKIGPTAPMGDYGQILVHGAYLDRHHDQTPVLHRAGPAVPHISMPDWDQLILTDYAVNVLHALNILENCEQIRNRHVIRLDWPAICESGEMPSRFAGSEPEDILLQSRHSAAADNAMPVLFEVVLVVGASALPGFGFGIGRRSWKGYDLFAVRDGRSVHVVATDSGRALLEKNQLSDFLKFTPVICK